MPSARNRSEPIHTRPRWVRGQLIRACEGGPRDVEQPDVVRSRPGLDEVGDDLANHRHEFEPVADTASTTCGVPPSGPSTNASSGAEAYMQVAASPGVR